MLHFDQLSFIFITDTCHALSVKIAETIVFKP